MKIVEQLETTRNEALTDLVSADSLEKVETVRIKYLGRKGSVTEVLKALKDLPAKEKPIVGQKANQIRVELENKINQTKETLSSQKLDQNFKSSSFDFSLPGKNPPIGNKHLVNQIIKEVSTIFISMGFQVEEGPEVELDYYNFTALNTPKDHPARSLQDTFYIKDVFDPNREDEPALLRTHTSPIQIRTMENKKPPLYIIAPGKAFRRDVADPSHTPMFHQIEGLAVAEGLSFSHLKGTLEVFVKQLFGEDRAIRLRPHFFPFTEPSAEVDVSCTICDGKAVNALSVRQAGSRQGCRLCGETGWLEILGCGMVDPNVLEGVGIDTEKFSGFAFGMGVERIAVLKHGLDDIRRLFDNDVRFLKQF